MDKRIILLLLFIVFSLNSCTNENQINAKKNQKILRLNLSQSPSSFDPRCVRSIRDLTLSKQLFEGLMRLNPEQKLDCALAEEYFVDEGKCCYTFKLRRACWSHGEPITAHDFVRSWKEICQGTIPTDYVHMLYVIKNAKNIKEGKCHSDELGAIAVDDQTLVVTLQEPTPYFLELTAFPTFFPLCGNDTSIFSGPFKIKSFSENSSLLLEKNPKYWDSQSVELDAISFSIINDSNTEYLLFEKGELDWVGQPISNAIAQEVLERSRVQSYPIAGTYWITFNTDIEPFNNIKFRRALSIVLSRQEMIQYLLQGKQKEATSCVPPSMKLQEEPYFADADVTQAKLLLQQAREEIGHDVGRITLACGTDLRTKKIVEVIQACWRDHLGLDVGIESMENTLFRANIKQGKFQTATGQWIADFNDPITFLEIFCFPRELGLNDSNWQNEQYKRWIAQAQIEKNDEKRQELLHQAESLLMDEMPIAPLYHYSFDYLKNEKVENVVLSPLGIADYKYTRLK